MKTLSTSTIATVSIIDVSNASNDDLNKFASGIDTDTQLDSFDIVCF